MTSQESRHLQGLTRYALKTFHESVFLAEPLRGAAHQPLWHCAVLEVLVRGNIAVLEGLRTSLSGTALCYVQSQFDARNIAPVYHGGVDPNADRASCQRLRCNFRILKYTR